MDTTVFHFMRNPDNSHSGQLELDRAEGRWMQHLATVVPKAISLMAAGSSGYIVSSE